MKHQKVLRTMPVKRMLIGGSFSQYYETMRIEAQKPQAGVSPAAGSELLTVARKVFWWGEPEQWLEDEVRFLAQVMTYGDWEDVQAAMKAFGQAAFHRVLQNPPPGVFDKKSWTFWHEYFHLPIPPLPGRKL